MARLRQKRDGRYYVDCQVAGRRVRRSLRTRDLDLAQQRFSQFLQAQVPAMSARGPRPYSLVKLARWHVETALADAPANAVRAARAAWRSFLNWCEGQGISRVSELTPASALLWYGWLRRKGYGQGLASAKVACIKAGIRAAVQEGLIPADPVGLWPKATRRQKALEEFAADQLRQLLEAVKRYAPEVYPVVLFLSATAWRISDALWLRHDHVDPFGAAVAARQKRGASDAGTRAGAGIRGASAVPCTSAGLVFRRRQKVPWGSAAARLRPACAA